MAHGVAGSAQTAPRTTWSVDAAIAVVATVSLLLVTTHIPVGSGERELDALASCLLVAAGIAVGLCRRAPGVAVAVVTVALPVYLARAYAGGPIFLTGWVAVASLSWRRGRRAGLVGAAVLCAALVAAAATARDLEPVVHLVFVGWTLVAVLAGEVLRARQDRVAQLEDRAREQERTRAEEARRHIAEERLRIARDLHDSVAHAMATINVQAGAAAHVVDRRPSAAKEALVAIQRASGDVLDELGALLGVLRHTDEAVARAPTPGVDRIPALVESTADARLRVALTMDGPIGDVPVPVGTAAYRIVQESLTNAIRHADGAPTAVRVTAGEGGSLVVEVVDDGGQATQGAGGTGMGIGGMRERAEATGGTLTAGPRPGGGWAVRATWGEQ